MTAATLAKLLPNPNASDEDWRWDGKCGEHDPELFWPVGLNVPALLQAEDAKRICIEECPVRLRCLQEALDNDEREGVWGGVNFAVPRERRRARGGRQIA